jgi:hypothetical protein
LGLLLQVTATEPLPTTNPSAPQIQPSAGQTADEPQPPSPPAIAPPGPTEPRYIPFASLEKGMGIASADGNFSVGLHFLFASRFEHVEKDGGRDDGFKVWLARPAVRGVAFRKWIEYFVQFSLEGAAPALLDAEVVVQPLPELGVKVGQFITPFSREFLVPPGALLLPDFAPSDLLFRNGRDVGAMFLGSAFEKRLEYWAGAVNGNGIGKNANDNAQLEWFARVAANAIGRHPYTEIPSLTKDAASLTFGLNASYADTEQTSSTLDAKTGAITTTRLGSSPTTKLGVDAWSHWGPFTLQAEAYSRTVQAVGGGPRKVARGGFAQVGYFIIEKTLQLAARGDLIDLDATHDSKLDKRIDIGANWYVHANNLKLQARYGWAESPNAVPPSPKGTSNTATLQAQLWF